MFLQITGAIERDLDVPDGPSLRRPQAAQAAGDAALADNGRPVLRLHLRDRAAGSTGSARWLT